MTCISRTAHRSAAWLIGAAALCMASAAMAQPANNNCANAIAIGNTTVSGTTAGASNDGTANCGSSGSSPDVWYRYTASATTNVTVMTCTGTGYDSVLSVHGAACGSAQIACNDDACNLQSSIIFPAVSGTQYLIRVSGFSNASGAFELSVGPGGGGQPPANDACASAEAIGNGTFNGTTNNSSNDGASSCSAQVAGDVYYRYTASATGAVTASTCAGGTFDTVVSVHTGCPASAVNQIACNDNFCGTRSQTTFQAISGTQYLIRVSAAAAAASGTFTLTMGEPPPPGPNGPDVTHQSINGIAAYAAVGGIRAYALGSDTCNLGDSDLIWANGGTPALGMNAYRIHNGRLMQIGLGFSKTACCAAAGSGCGVCNGHGGNVLGAGCKDVYGAGYNGAQGHLAPRSVINGYTGTIAAYPQTSGDTIFRRLQIAQNDMTTTMFPGARYFVEGAYVATDDAGAGNAMNNNSYMPVTINQSSFEMSSASGTAAGIPAIRAWRDHGLGLNQADTSVTISSVNVPMEGRFWIATKVTDLGNGRWLYDYAVYNMNSDRSGYSLSIPLGAGVAASAVGFHDINYHSGEPYDNTDWVGGVGATAVEWHSPQTFAQNANTNALRWGTMYNFWFEANSAPVTGSATLGLFKPGTPSSVTFDAPIPSGGCAADWNHDGSVTSQDFFDFVAAFFNSSADFNNDGQTNSQDYFDFIAAFFTPCP